MVINCSPVVLHGCRGRNVRGKGEKEYSVLAMRVLGPFEFSSSEWVGDWPVGSFAPNEVMVAHPPVVEVAADQFSLKKYCQVNRQKTIPIDCWVTTRMPSPLTHCLISR